MQFVDQGDQVQQRTQHMMYSSWGSHMQGHWMFLGMPERRRGHGVESTLNTDKNHHMYTASGRGWQGRRSNQSSPRFLGLSTWDLGQPLGEIVPIQSGHSKRGENGLCHMRARMDCRSRCACGDVDSVFRWRWTRGCGEDQADPEGQGRYSEVWAVHDGIRDLRRA